MPISSIIINVADVARSVDFYTTHLQARPIGEVSSERAVLDVVTATIELVALGADAATSTWVSDDLQRGFRHVGFKVDTVDPRAQRLREAGVLFHLDPLEAEGGVRITFFTDPDGTMLELVERDLQYTQILDQAGVEAERALGVPDRPRFDHVATTVADLAATQERYARLGFTPIGTIAQPADPRGFDITYLKSGDTVLEVFTYQADKTTRQPQLDAPGYLGRRPGRPDRRPDRGRHPRRPSGAHRPRRPDHRRGPAVSGPGSAGWTRPLGTTGLSVSAVCVGGAPLGSMPANFGYEVAAEDAVALVQQVLASPIRFIDTANGYSDGRASGASAPASPLPAGCPTTSWWPPRSTPATGTTPGGGCAPRWTRAASAWGWSTCRWCTCTTRSSTPGRR